MRLPDRASAGFEAEHLELAVIHLVAWVHEEGFARIRLQFSAAIVVLLSKVKPVHFCTVVILKSLDFVEKSQVADFEHLRLTFVINRLLTFWQIIEKLFEHSFFKQLLIAFFQVLAVNEASSRWCLAESVSIESLACLLN